MRYLAAILSIYVMFLTITPCCADDDCAKMEQSDHGKECGICSPFYSCSTCSSGFTFKAPYFPILQFDETPQKTIAEYKDCKLPLISTSIWQPPKLA